MSLTSCTFEVFGKVQGVWFRKHCIQSGKKFGVVGYVRNTERGTVEGVVQGSPGAVAEFKESLRIGSPKSRVDECRTTDTEIQVLEFASFEKKH